METFIRKGMRVRVRTLAEIKSLPHVTEFNRDGKYVGCHYRGMGYGLFSDADYDYIGEEGIVERAGYEEYIHVRMKDGSLQYFPYFCLEVIPFKADEQEQEQEYTAYTFAFNTDVSESFTIQDIVDLLTYIDSNTIEDFESEE
jgi:hypothetical protein